MKRFTVEAVKWRDSINGNTYHACQITRHADDRILRCPMTYGYGDHYRNTALLAMRNAYWIDNDSNYEVRHNYPIIWIVYNGLKRDLKRVGG
jgi:acetone carboxylase gamma subunit